MDKVYGIFTGAYSDWNVIGYFTNKEDAKKYCAVKNSQRKMYDDDYYHLDIDELTEDFKDVKLRKYHHVGFNFGKGRYRKPGMNKDAYHCEEYVGEKKETKANFNSLTYSIKFMIDCDTRKKAEKIAQDNWYNFMNNYKLIGDYEQAFKMMANSFIGEDNE